MTPRGTVAPHLAFVLHRYDWSESSLIVDLFTREAGRVVVAAKGAKRPTSGLRAVLLPFQRIAVSFGHARSEVQAEVHNLRGAEWSGGSPTIGGPALLAGFYLNELLMKLLARDDPHPALWDLYALVLERLGGADEPLVLRAFELVLLRELGLLPDLAHVTANQAAVERDRHYTLWPEGGLAAAAPEAGATLAGAQLMALQAALARGSFDDLREACRTAEVPLRRQLRRMLAYHLGHAPLRTREVVRELRSMLDLP
ncbi:MAG: DNA repair protein RecO [Aquincola sp.]|nr:DNA repair protein RecO [Aquincola sp.]MDH4288424.1 DNA repair protein RecO [Aquincola sp.]MDH5329413.1 DNA repair protein RecO [Aquincola sp.]